ncbi:MAG TPA: hypothetical protein VE973_01510, partial [Candidatus Limnocylindria bacterium]|nr:hypothetical protein [Candidatus Limnocylindria bacterium]
MKNHYFKTKMKKMGRWALLPADSGNWHGQDSCNEFRKVFGFGKGLLAIHTLEDGMQYMYTPLELVEMLNNYMAKLRSKGLKVLENKFRVFYEVKKQAREAVVKLARKDYSKLSNNQLATAYEKIRHWTHKATIYDQFGWLSEEYWNEPMDAVLIKKLGLKKGSDEYYNMLFSLTKPEEISTTLEEKRAVLKAAINLKQNRAKIQKLSQTLAKAYGWMPVFTYGQPWDAKHYQTELLEISKNKIPYLKAEYEKLLNYSELRNKA